MTPEQILARAEAWRKVETALSEIQGSHPLDLDIEGDFSLAKPEQSHLRILLDGRRQQWRGVICDACSWMPATKTA